ncbi:hypothetical protein [Tomitella gaofuii]|uniref:hypothetical protein n=1 Tax=Tomitella gaofuii TaxID=2760083 RepID=UPI0015FD645C|nr:hypothetical protein [Tomitella gaofuii]
MPMHTRIRSCYTSGGEDEFASAIGQLVAAAKAAVPVAAYAGITGSTHHAEVRSYGATDSVIDGLVRSQTARHRPWPLVSGGSRTITIADTAADGRWPEFTSAARRSGIGSILAVGLSEEDPALGTLSLYATDAGAFTDGDETITAVFAGRAAALLRSHADGGDCDGNDGDGDGDTGSRDGAPLVVEVCGDIDSANAAAFALQLSWLPARDTIVHLAGLQFCSARGLELLLEHSRRLAENGASLWLADCPRALWRVIGRLRLDEALPVLGTSPRAAPPVTDSAGQWAARRGAPGQAAAHMRRSRR